MLEYQENWLWQPKGEPGDWEPCQCDCHSPGLSRSVHAMACCEGGWKKTFQLRAKEMRELDERAAREQETAAIHKPAHGGYPGKRLTLKSMDSDNTAASVRSVRNNRNRIGAELRGDDE